MGVILVQHGEAAAKETDPARPLTPAGRETVRALGRVLAAAGIQPAEVRHSGKRRAQQSAELLAAALGTGAPEVMAGIGPNDPVEGFGREFATDGAVIVVVGHLPFVGRAATGLLTGAPEPVIIDFEPGAAASLRCSDGHWSLEWFLRPGIFSPPPV